MAIEERAEPSGSSKLQWPVTAGLRFQAIAGELVRADRDRYSRGDFKGRQQNLAMGVPVELKTITGVRTSH